MRMIILASLMLLIAAFVPRAKCTLKFQLNYLAVLVVTCVYVAYKATVGSSHKTSDVFFLTTNHLETTLSMLAIYFTAIGSLTLLVKSMLPK